MSKHPRWHTADDDSSWERVKAAFRNDWEQTKHDFGADSARDLDQDVDDTVKQMAGKQSTAPGAAFEDREDAFKYGYSAQRHYADEHPEWNEKLESKLRNDYPGNYDQDRPFIKHAYKYNYR